MVDVGSALVPVPSRIRADQDVGAEPPHLPGDGPPEIERHLDHPVLDPQEGALGNAQHVTGGSLFGFSQLGELLSDDPGFIRAGRAVGHAHVADLGPGPGPRGDRAGRAELGIVGVGEDDQGAFEVHVRPD